MVKLVDVIRREAAKPENQARIREFVERARREVAEPENQRGAKEMVSKFSNRPGKAGPRP